MPSAVVTISSCAFEPRHPASSKPSPISTPLIAWMPISAPARRASSRRSQCTCEPRPDGHAVREHLDDPAQRVAVLVGLVDLRDHRLRRVGVQAAHRVRVQLLHVGRRRVRRPAAPSPGQLDDMGDDLDPGRLLEVRPGHGAERDPGGGLPGRGALQDRPGLVEAVLLHAREVGVARDAGRVSGALRARPARISGSTGSAAITCSHFGHSVLPTMTATGEPRVRPCRTPPRKVTSSRSNFIRAPRP